MTPVKRTSDLPAPRTRKEHAAATRLRAIQAALARFTSDGYTATTMASIAQDAGVAVQTLYFTFGTKGDLLQAVYEHVVLDEHGCPPHLTTWWSAVETDPDVTRAVRTLTTGTSKLLERAAPVVMAVVGDPTARAGYDHNETLRRAGNEHLVAVLSAKYPLRSGLSSKRACASLLVLTGPLVYTQLTRDLGWSRKQAADWMADIVLRELFDLPDQTR